MSNFSTFFPSGSGGGEGAGINSYAPFSVVSDNNPQGYVASTGVYTNPVDDSVWLKTGKFLSTSFASTYPNATQGIIPDTSNLPIQFPRSKGFAANATHVYETGYSNNNVYKYAITGGGALVGANMGFTPSATIGTGGVFLTSNRVYVYAQYSGGYKIETFDLDLNDVGSERIIGIPQFGRPNSFAKVGTSWFTIGATSAYNTVVEYNSDFSSVLNTYTVNNISSPTQTSYINTIAYDGTNFWITNVQDQGNAFEYNSSFVATGASFQMTVLQSPANSLGQAGYNAGNSKYFALSQDTGSPFETYYQEFQTVIGDIARTDLSGSTKPLFIKIK